jgi:preprotein translocase subunit SecF
MNIFPKTPNFDILGQRKFWLMMSLLLTGLTIVWPLIRAPNWGVDFAGGNELQIQFTGDVDVAAVHKAIDAAGLSDANIQQFGDPSAHEFLVRVGRSSLYTNEQFEKNVEPKLRQDLPQLDAGKEGVAYTADEGDQVTLTSKEGAAPLTPDGIRKTFETLQVPVQDVRVITEGRSFSVLFRGVSNKVEQALRQAFPTKVDPNQSPVRRVEQVGASVGTELKIAAVKSVLLSILLILLYVGFRFDFAFATGAIVSLVHDAVIVVGFYLISGAELNNTTIAAVLTIIGYSVNDTVIIYDRIRENLTKHKGRELYRTINDSINETLSRTIITHFTVLLSLMGLVFFTVGTLREFSLAMMVGVITGTYSSVYIASPIVIWLEEVLRARRERNGGGNAQTPRVAATNP